MNRTAKLHSAVSVILQDHQVLMIHIHSVADLAKRMQAEMQT